MRYLILLLILVGCGQASEQDRINEKCDSARRDGGACYPMYPVAGDDFEVLGPERLLACERTPAGHLRCDSEAGQKLLCVMAVSRVRRCYPEATALDPETITIAFRQTADDGTQKAASTEVKMFKWDADDLVPRRLGCELKGEPGNRMCDVKKSGVNCSMVVNDKGVTVARFMPIEAAYLPNESFKVKARASNQVSPCSATLIEQLSDL